ncbi:MAG: LysE family transporter [Pseudomonadota bacterium]
MFEAYLWLAAVWLVAAATPGPNFFAVMHVAAQNGRRSALAVALGTVVGTAIWASAGFFGLAALFALVPDAAAAIKLAGAAYLVWVGFGLWQAASAEETPVESSATGAFLFGFATNLANPKTAAFAASIFAVALPSDAGAGASLGAIGLVCAISSLWYGAMALIGSGAYVVTLYRTWRRAVLRTTGVLFAGFGISLAAETLAEPG